MAKSIKRIYYGIIQRIKKISYSFHKNNICVLMFHDVYTCENNDNNLNISKENFLEFIEKLKKSDVNFVRINDLLDSKTKKCIITFDDVCEGAVVNAVPILRKFEIPYTLFVSTSLIDKKGYITSAQIESLNSDSLCTFGFHTKSHKLMRPLKETAITDEIDCTEFEKQYGIKCEYFAYPYGSVYACSRKNVNQLKNSKYTMAFSTINACTNKKIIARNPYYIPRINVCDISYRAVLDKVNKLSNV